MLLWLPPLLVLYLTILVKCSKCSKCSKINRMPDNRLLDYDENAAQEQAAEKGRNQAYYLELLPIVIISIGLVLFYYKQDYWNEVIMLGGGLAVFFYLFLSWYLFGVGTYTKLELFFSILAGLLFSAGIIGIILHVQFWSNAPLFLQISFWGSIALFCGTMIAFIFHLSDQRASIFYRNLLARLLVFIAILARLYPLF